MRAMLATREPGPSPSTVALRLERPMGSDSALTRDAVHELKRSIRQELFSTRRRLEKLRSVEGALERALAELTADALDTKKDAP